ncbi:SIR2 family protein [Halomonas titanicae]|uniref:SIR2 family NAD-dependent protein deacylase n=1 Tax=Vreelandella titanicae TaxID=664683 RepID=UPI001F2E1C0C|nr:SIR2 family protein [Halomonas titanicae]MCE7521204.1 SIR2 family protein [Halomonas titanicae]
MLIGNWPEHLIKDIARRKVVLVIGAGVSKHAVGLDGVTKPPVWKEFLLNAAEAIGRNPHTEHIFKAIEDGDLLHACEWLKNRYDEDWAAHLRSKFVDPRYIPGELHELLALLDLRVVFSLNFDDIYENRSREINETSQFVKNYNDSDVCEFLRGDARYIVKVHGNLSSPATLIFTQKDYSEARVKYNLFYSAFNAALMSHTFLFIGCGYGDPDVNLILENQAFRALPGSIGPHYFVTSSQMPDDLKESLRRNRNLKTLNYDKIDDNHSGLVHSIKVLLERVESARSELMENNNW